MATTDPLLVGEQVEEVSSARQRRRLTTKKTGLKLRSLTEEEMHIDGSIELNSTKMPKSDRTQSTRKKLDYSQDDAIGTSEDTSFTAKATQSKGSARQRRSHRRKKPSASVQPPSESQTELEDSTANVASLLQRQIEEDTKVYKTKAGHTECDEEATNNLQENSTSKYNYNGSYHALIFVTT